MKIFIGMVVIMVFIIIIPDIQAMTLDDEIITSQYPEFYASLTNSCEPLIVNSQNQNYGDRINIVVFGYGFPDEVAAKSEVIRMLGTYNSMFFKVAPFDMRRNAFNVWYHKQIGVDTNAWNMQSGYTYSGRQCPVDIVVIISKSFATTRKFTIQGSTTIVVTNTNDNQFIHELGGHAVGGLEDEYLGLTNDIGISKMNCDLDSLCSKFKNIPGYNQNWCTLWCNGKNTYRPQVSSVMWSPTTTTDFGIVNTYIINKRIDRMAPGIMPLETISQPTQDIIGSLNDIIADLYNSIRNYICMTLNIWC